VFVVGYGSGATAGACLQFPGVKVTCAEIEREVFRASRWFAAVNNGAERSPDLELRFEDGRAHLMGTQQSYELIVTEPSNPWLAGISSLFTREFLVAARERLGEGGLLAQWMQTYALAPEDYRLLLRTIADVFPHVALLRLTAGDTVVLASEAELVPGQLALDRAQARFDASPGARGDLLRYFGSADVRSVLLTHCILGGAGLRELAGTAAAEGLNTDANQRLEHDAPLRLFQTEAEHGTRVDAFLLGGVRAGWQRELAEQLGGGTARGAALHGLQELLRARGLTQGADALVALGLELAPEHPGLQAERLIHGGLDGVALEAGIGALLERSTSDAMRVALAAEDAGDAERALLVLDAILARKQGSVTARAHRAQALWMLGRLEEARAELAELVDEDPLSEEVRAAVRRMR
jgi:spermidine synthase